MGDMTIGIALFVLIIVIGLVIGLRLSSTTAQRRAVVVAFGSMAAIAVLFYVFAMQAAQLWAAPVFAIACIVVPIGAYTLMMRGVQPDKVVSRRSANEAPKPIRSDRANRTTRPATALDAAVMPMTPNHPVNEYLSLQPEDVELAEDMDAEATSDEAMAEPAATGVAAADEAPIAEADVTAELSSDELAGAAEAQHGEDAADAEVSGDEAAAEGDRAQDAETRPTATEAFIEEYLVEQNEDEGGLFEPEASPSLQTEKPGAAVTSTSTMMVTIPFSEGDERFLVVSESTSVPNPILAYKRTTSSHLVPMGSAKHGPREKTPLHADLSAPVPLREKPAAPAAPEQPVFEQPTLTWDDARAEEASPAAASAPAAPEQLVPAPAAAAPVEVSVPEPAAPESASAPVATEFRPTVEAAPAVAPSAPVAAVAASAAVAAAPAPTPTPAVESVAAPAPVPSASAAPVSVAESAAPAEAESRPAVEPAAPEPAAVRQEAPVPASAAAPAPVGAAFRPPTAPAAEPQPTAPEPQPAPAPAAPEPAVKPAAPAPAVVSEERFQEIMDKAQSLRERGMHPVAARLYAQAAESAPRGDAQRQARFEEIACYVKAGQNDKARALAAQLRTSNVLTRVERIKLDAIERMG
ncbi:hypothetical protein VJ918_07810 [Adlercreutzia sp. R21]|uniref:hypothetical protein n=1 Tax=Adlercreutzia wanghongyangiae TaxID=3111451 RepID=UPI002DC04426|nr:hypothetical protein [Adlercreutzia sp. R21]MEC4184711.1 hypothetical protein [Adlercreutzia sp. R21]